MRTIRADQHRQAQMLAEVSAGLRRLEHPSELPALMAGLARQSLVDRQFDVLTARLGAVERHIEESQITDPHAFIVNSIQQLQRDVTALATLRIAHDPAPVTDALDRLQQVSGIKKSEHAGYRAGI